MTVAMIVYSLQGANLEFGESHCDSLYKLRGQVRERPTNEPRRAREVSWRLRATNTGVAPAPAPTRRPDFWAGATD